MNELSLFAGAGGGILGGKLLGWRTICAVEINAFCCRRLLQRQNEGHLPLFPIWDNVCTFDGTAWKGSVDVVSGGFPCQPFSTATHGHKTATDFWPEMFRIVKEVVPKFIFAENVSLSAIAQAADDCESIGYKAEIAAISAADVGADHIRERYWLLAYADLHSELCSPINAETQKLPEFYPSIWTQAPEAFGSGMDDGLAARMDRLKAIGNGQVPAVAAVAWHTLMEIAIGKEKENQCQKN